MDKFIRLKKMLEDIIEKYSIKCDNISIKIDDISIQITQNERNIDDLQTQITETEETIKKMKKYKKLKQTCKSYVIPFFCIASIMVCSLPFFLEGTINISEIFLPKYAIFGVAEILITSYCVTISSYYRKLNNDLIKPYTLEEEIDNLANLYERKEDEERILGNNIEFKSHLATKLKKMSNEKETFEDYLMQLNDNEAKNINNFGLDSKKYAEILRLVRAKSKNC